MSCRARFSLCARRCSRRGPHPSRCCAPSRHHTNTARRPPATLSAWPCQHGLVGMAFPHTISSLYRWDPSEDSAVDEPLAPPPAPNVVAPAWEPPPPEYSVPEDGCEQVTLDQYARYGPAPITPRPRPQPNSYSSVAPNPPSVVFGKANSKQEAWICAEDELKDAQDKGETCNLVSRLVAPLPPPPPPLLAPIPAACTHRPTPPGDAQGRACMGLCHGLRRGAKRRQLAEGAIERRCGARRGREPTRPLLGVPRDVCPVSRLHEDV